MFVARQFVESDVFVSVACSFSLLVGSFCVTVHLYSFKCDVICFIIFWHNGKNCCHLTHITSHGGGECAVLLHCSRMASSVRRFSGVIECSRVRLSSSVLALTGGV